MILKRDYLWAYAAQIMNVGIGLIMLPIIVRYMSKIEVGLWFVFITLGALAQLLDFGFQPTIARNFSYVFAGAKNLTKSGLQKFENGNLSQELLGDLIISSRWIYSRVSLLVAIILLVGGTFYVYTAIPEESFSRRIIYAWITYSIGVVINFYYGYLGSILQGRGEYSKYNKATIYSRGINFVVGVFLVCNGYGLLGLGVSSLACAFTYRILLYRYGAINKYKISICTHDRRREIVKILWHNSSRFGVVLLAVFLIWRANTLIATSSLGILESTSYIFAIQIFILINTIASVPFNLYLPKLNALRSHGDNKEIYNTFSVLIVTTLIVYMVAFMAMLIIGNYFLSMLGSSTKLPDSEILIWMGIIFLLEINHGTCANFITTGNKIPFVSSSIITGIAIFTLSICLAPIYGIAGLLFSQGIVQIIYNNWRWPYEAASIFNVSYFNLLKNGVKIFSHNIIK